MATLVMLAILTGCSLWVYRQWRDLRRPSGGGTVVVSAGNVVEGQSEPLSAPMPPAKSNKVKALLLLLVLIGYVLSPVDVVPDLVPVFGNLDDLLAMYFGMQRVIAWRQGI